MPVRSTTRFQAGSISKQLLAVVALLVAQEDRLGLHEPVSQWLPDLRPELRNVTLDQLLSHTSGLGHWADVPGLDISFTGTVCGRPARFHAGDNPGYRSLLAYLPHDDRHVAVLTNDDGPPLEIPVRLAVDTEVQ
jgi:CubicO group peptidase (beta-lactamase class C family)